MGATRERINADVAVVGAGPAGLRAAIELATRYGVDPIVVERESQAGGIPRHCFHPGYGIRDMKRFISGPRYAASLVREAERAGIKIRTQTMATGWGGERELELTSPDGLSTISAQAIVLATGARERGRPARWIVGDRPAGIYTTGKLQNDVHLFGHTVGRTAVVVGAQLVSWSAVLTLRHAGCQVALMTTEHSRPEAYAAFTYPGRIGLGIKVATYTKVVAIHGRGRVESVEIEDLRTGHRRRVSCDTVVLTGDWIPDYELVEMAGIVRDQRTLGPRVTQTQATSIEGVFAAGNLIHPVDTADCASLDGTHVAAHVFEYLNGNSRCHSTVRIEAGDGFDWVTPGEFEIGGGLPSRGKLLAWPSSLVYFPEIEARQGQEVIGRWRSPYPASPGRVFRMPAALLLRKLDSGEHVKGIPVTLSIVK